MALRLGVDMVTIERVRRLADTSAFAERAFHPSERAAGASPRHLAGILALKEAIAKAFDVTPPPWQDVSVTWSASGRPRLVLSPALAARGTVLDASVSHERDIAVALVLVRLHPSTESTTGAPLQ